MRPDHGSCLRNTRARLSFPVMTGVMLCEPGYWRSERMTITAINAKGEKK